MYSTFILFSVLFSLHSGFPPELRFNMDHEKINKTVLTRTPQYSSKKKDKNKKERCLDLLLQKPKDSTGFEGHCGVVGRVTDYDWKYLCSSLRMSTVQPSGQQVLAVPSPTSSGGQSLRGSTPVSLPCLLWALLMSEHLPEEAGLGSTKVRRTNQQKPPNWHFMPISIQPRWGMMKMVKPLLRYLTYLKNPIKVATSQMSFGGT